MTQPYPTAPPQQPQYPAPPQQGYPPNPYGQQTPQSQVPQGYAPPQYPQAPANPYAHPQTAQHYPGPPGYPYGAPQQPYAQQPPAPQVPAGPPPSLGDFYAQPSTGWGPSVTPNGATPDGTQVLMVVAQHITQAHVEQATQFDSTALAYFRNGKPKLVMKIPTYVAPGTQYWIGKSGAVQQITDGRAQYFCQGPDKDALAAAIAAAGGNAAEPPELGAVILVTKTSNRRNNAGTQSAVKTFRYWRPGPEAAGMAQQFGITYPDLSTPKPADASPVTAPVSTAAPAGPPPPAPSAVAPPVPQQAAAPVQQYAPAPATPPAPPAAPAEGLDAERQALLAQLTGQPAS